VNSILDIHMLNPLLRAFIIGLIPAGLTSLGSLLILLKVNIKEKQMDIGMGFAAGVMLVASFTGLLLPAIEAGGVLIALTGFIIGVFLIKILDKIIPHTHFVKGYEGPSTMRAALKKAWLIALAMIIHNIPEGMAVGAMTILGVTEGLTMAFAIGLQDIPEGLAVALPIFSTTKSKKKAILLGSLSGVIEALTATIPPLIVSLIGFTLPLVLALAAGAMIYVVTHEIIPDIYGHEHDEPSTLGFFIGFLTMLILDTILNT